MLKPTCVLLLGLITNGCCEMEGFVVGGTYANIEQHPHSAFLNVHCVTGGIKSTWICGSSIVNQRILLSAAHCLDECTAASHIIIRIGDKNTDKGLRYLSYAFMLHENYNPQTSSSDIALIKTNGPLPLGHKISRVALMMSPPYSEKAMVAGWGMIDEYHEIHTNFLKSVPQNVWSRQNCLNTFGSLPRGTFCAAAPNKKEEYPAQGDSGGALLVRNYIQLGLVSFKVPSISSSIIIYTDVGYFYDWIKISTKRMYCFVRPVNK